MVFCAPFKVTSLFKVTSPWTVSVPAVAEPCPVLPIVVLPDSPRTVNSVVSPELSLPI